MRYMKKYKKPFLLVENPFFLILHLGLESSPARLNQRSSQGIRQGINLNFIILRLGLEIVSGLCGLYYCTFVFIEKWKKVFDENGYVGATLMDFFKSLRHHQSWSLNC